MPASRFGQSSESLTNKALPDRKLSEAVSRVFGMEILGERPVWSLSDSEQLATLDALQAEITRLQTYRLQVLAAYDATGHAATLGAGDTARLLAFRHRLDPGVIKRDLDLAKTLPKYPAVAAALPATTIADPDSEPNVDSEADAVVLSPAQAQAIVSVLEDVPDTVAVEDLAVAEHQLVALARHFSPSELRKAARRVRDLLDADGPAPDEDKAYAREELRLRTADRGVRFSGYLANDNAELFQSLILSGSKPRKTVTGELDPRGPDKRRADALTDVLTVASNAIITTPTDTATSGASAEAGHGPKAHITVTIDLKDLTDAGPHALGTLTHGEGLSAGAIRRLACEAQIIPIVLGANSEPLEVGMAQRFVNRAIRRALNARDKGCVVCGAPPIFCDAHHLISWLDHGPTALTNLVLLCRPHHIDTHHGHWTITHHQGTVTVTRPAWAEPDRLARHRHRRPTHSLTSATTGGSTPAGRDTAAASSRPATRDTATATGTPANSDGGALGLLTPARNRANAPVRTTTTTTDNPAAGFDPWADTDPPDPDSGKTFPPTSRPRVSRTTAAPPGPRSGTTDD